MSAGFRISETMSGSGVDIISFIAEGGIKWQRNDVDGEEAGRTMDVRMHRFRRGMKVRMDISCRTLNSSEAMILLNAIFPEYVYVTYLDPMFGERTAQFYSNNVPASCGTIYPDGTAEWEGITFPLVEV